MKALIMEKYGEFRYTDVPIPSPREQEVLIKVKACAVCGSDVHGIDGGTGRRIPPIVMGHEAAGVIAECGRGVIRYRPGDRVTFDSTIYCGECDACLEGNINLCQTRRVLGVSCEEYRMNGAFAEYVTVPEYVLSPIPGNVSFERAAMTEPLAVALHATSRTPFASGNTAAVVGAGTIGLLLIQVLKNLGARVAAVDIDDDKLRLAKKAGADFCINSSAENAAERILLITENKGADAAYDAVGIPSSVKLCVNAAKANGSVVLIGNIAPNVELPLQRVVTKQQSLYGSCASAGEYPECLKLISEGAVDVDMLISRVVPLSEGGEWMKLLYAKERGLLKVIFVP